MRNCNWWSPVFEIHTHGGGMRNTVWHHLGLGEGVVTNFLTYLINCQYVFLLWKSRQWLLKCPILCWIFCDYSNFDTFKVWNPFFNFKIQIILYKKPVDKKLGLSNLSWRLTFSSPFSKSCYYLIASYIVLKMLLNYEAQITLNLFLKFESCFGSLLSKNWFLYKRKSDISTAKTSWSPKS